MDELPPPPKRVKRRGCLIVGALVLALLAGLAWLYRDAFTLLWILSHHCSNC